MRMLAAFLVVTWSLAATAAAQEASPYLRLDDPVMPFVALAMMLALRTMPRVSIAIALIHAVISWPSLVPKYAHRDAWRLDKIPWREALRIGPEEGYLERRLFNNESVIKGESLCVMNESSQFGVISRLYSGN